MLSLSSGNYTLKDLICNYRLKALAKLVSLDYPRLGLHSSSDFLLTVNFLNYFEAISVVIMRLLLK